MNERRLDQPWEQWLRKAAGAFPYPPTPELASVVSSRPQRPFWEQTDRQGSRRAPRRLAWAAAAMIVFLASLLAAPDVRAALHLFLRLGAIEIVLPGATSSTTSTASAATTAPTAVSTPVPTARPSPSPRSSILDLAGETDLAGARKQAPFPIRLPAYPADLGAPDRIFVTDFEGPVVVLVWTVPGQPEQVRLSLHLLDDDAIARKFGDEFTTVRETTVDGKRAFWVVGPHVLTFYRSRNGLRSERLVTGHVLIWEEGPTTYRLETDLPLREAVRIAESVP